MKKRPKRTPQSLSAGTSSQVGGGPLRAPASLQYKVIELSTVDEGTVENAVNEWVRQGWDLDGVQFAMRESSKRPAMAFVFFTRRAERAEHDSTRARARLVQMANENDIPKPVASAFGRLREQE